MMGTNLRDLAALATRLRFTLAGQSRAEILERRHEVRKTLEQLTTMRNFGVTGPQWVDTELRLRAQDIAIEMALRSAR